jgi:prepilin-type N-terminal cleavage/methylation domain-containing protein
MSRAPADDHRSGFTLLEVVVALLLLTGTFLAVAQLLVLAGRAADHSRTTSIAATLASQKLEQLREVAYGFDEGGAPFGGPALSPAGSLTADTAGFVDYQDESGSHVAGGPPPPARAMFARRWSVQSADGAASPDVLVLRVVVLRQRLASAGGAGGGRVWAEVTRVVSARARRPS